VFFFLHFFGAFLIIAFAQLASNPHFKGLEHQNRLGNSKKSVNT